MHGLIAGVARTPAQRSAAPSRAQAAEVQRPSRAKGIAMVAKMMPKAKKASVSVRMNTGRFRNSSQASGR